MDESISTFMAVTAADEEVAKQYLEFANQDIENAITLYLESGGAPIGGSSSNNISSPPGFSGNESDEAFAQRLQGEAYQEDQTRAPIQAIHETLVDDGFGSGWSSRMSPQPSGIFGNGPRSVFNQRDEEDYEIDQDDEDDEDFELQLDGFGNVIERPRERIRLTATQRRLANIFRPPFDLMEKLDLDSAKIKGRHDRKWIMVNIQDSSNFQCQVLNRDFWSSNNVKDLIRENFIFLQYQHDSPNGDSYKNFYSFEEYPHIAILDPYTGERLKQWSGSIPAIDDFIEDVYDFLNKFSLVKSHINPIVEHEKKVNPLELSEEQQIEFAMKQSLGASSSESPSKTSNTPSNIINLDSEPEIDEEEIQEISETEFKKPVTEEDIFHSIQPMAYEEPAADPKTTTRIQIRFSDGKRVVYRFALDVKVDVIYSFLKTQEFYKEGAVFNLTSQRTNLITELEKTIDQAGLKNASILLEWSE